jgi:hypothetical protein
MGILTWMMVAIVLLAIIGQGWNSFVSSIFKGISRVLDSINPLIRDASKEAKHYIYNITKNASAL